MGVDPIPLGNHHTERFFILLGVLNCLLTLLARPLIVKQFDLLGTALSTVFIWNEMLIVILLAYVLTLYRYRF